MNRTVSQTTGYAPYVIATRRQPRPFLATLSPAAAATAVVEEVEIDLVDDKEEDELLELPQGSRQGSGPSQINTVRVSLKCHFVTATYLEALWIPTQLCTPPIHTLLSFALKPGHTTCLARL